MANAEYERARARARLALIAPTVDEVTAAYFDSQVEKVLLEARQNGEKSDQELISTLLDAVARNISPWAFATAITSKARMAITSRARIGDHEQSSDGDHEQSSGDHPPHPDPTRR